jgi:hypothetical protein
MDFPPASRKLGYGRGHTNFRVDKQERSGLTFSKLAPLAGFPVREKLGCASASSERGG